MLKPQIDTEFKTFNPRDYLNEYYTHIGNENLNLLKFFVKAYKHISKNSLMLEFSGGPTIYPLISAAPLVSKIHFADYLDKNLNEIKLWKKNSPEAFNWKPFIIQALQIEGRKKIKDEDIIRRENLIREKLTRFFYCDAHKIDPLGKKYRNYYHLVNVNFVTDSITSSKKTWKQLITNICSLVRKGGILAMSALKNATYWRAGNNFFPAVDINEKDIKKILNRLGFKILNLNSIKAEVVDEKSPDYEGYKGMMFVIAKKLDFF
ncbi:hypothetical protein HY612_01130 [Candidatus Roizmanbacteria bacterium]|nr:hypothetical protein [Candidatus Roizmanbacteria bacterium]